MREKLQIVMVAAVLAGISVVGSAACRPQEAADVPEGAADLRGERAPGEPAGAGAGALEAGQQGAAAAEGAAGGQGRGIDPQTPAYARASGISGNLSSVGSDTLNNLMTLWAEDFKGHYPNVNIQIQGAGTSTAPPALTEGTANFGPMSRTMRQTEAQAFEKRHGYPPTLVPVAVDVLAVYVHRDNPIEGLTIPQVDALFSSTRRCGAPADITRWGQLGMTGAWANRDFALYSRNAVSGTYGFFKEHALCDGDYKASINEQPGSASVVQGVTNSLNGIGYSGIGYITPGVRAVPLARKQGEGFKEASAANAADGSYPLSRFLYIAVNKHPNRPLSPLEAEFFKMVLSTQGQEAVVRDGYIPLPLAVVQRERQTLGLN